MANTIKRENNRTYEFVPLGVLKYNATTGVAEAPGAATATPTGQVWNSGVQQIVDQGATLPLGSATTNEFPAGGLVSGYPIIKLSSMANVYIGGKVSDAGSLKFFPTAANAEIVGINEKTKTIWVNVAPVRSIAEAIEQNTKVLATKETELTTTLKIDNFKELPILTSANAKKTGVLPTGAIELSSSAYQFADNVSVTVNILEGTATAVTEIPVLLTSFDGGNTWVESGAGATLAITEKGAGSVQFSIKDKIQGQRFALAFQQTTSLTKASGYAIVSCDRVSGINVRA